MSDSDRRQPFEWADLIELIHLTNGAARCQQTRLMFYRRKSFLINSGPINHSPAFVSNELQRRKRSRQQSLSSSSSSSLSSSSSFSSSSSCSSSSCSSWLSMAGECCNGHGVRQSFIDLSIFIEWGQLAPSGWHQPIGWTFIEWRGCWMFQSTT